VGWSLKPKRNAFLHLGEDQALEVGNPDFWCYMDEDIVGRLGKVSGRRGRLPLAERPSDEPSQAVQGLVHSVVSLVACEFYVCHLTPVVHLRFCTSAKTKRWRSIILAIYRSNFRTLQNGMTPRLKQCRILTFAERVEFPIASG